MLQAKPKDGETPPQTPQAEALRLALFGPGSGRASSSPAAAIGPLFGLSSLARDRIG